MIGKKDGALYGSTENFIAMTRVLFYCGGTVTS